MNAIVAMDLNRTIGNQGKIPWHISEDLKFFKQITSSRVNGGTLLMGRKTFDSVGLLPNRFTYVLTHNPELELEKIKNSELSRWVDVWFKFVTTEQFETDVKLNVDKTWICGGAEVYKRYIPLCDSVFVSIVFGEYEGDTKLHVFEDDFPNHELIKEYSTHRLVKYSK